MLGIDFLDITFRIEREFGVKLTHAGHQKLWRADLAAHMSSNEVKDFRVADLVRAIEDQFAENNVPTDVLPRVQRIVSECLACPLSEVVPEAWLVRDLGME